MYNHYIPQSDGSYRRNPMAEPVKRSPRPAPPAPPEPPPPPPPEPAPCIPPPLPCKEPEHRESALSFLRKLLPKDLDSWDLVIIAFLLVLSGEECESGLSPLLTVALYFLL